MNRFLSVSLLVTVAGSVACTLASCSDTSCENSGTCASSGSSGDAGDAGVDAVGPPPGCDPNAEPKDAPKCVVSEFGVFVNGTSGSDTNAGTKESPKKTIGAALQALAGKPRVYVCEGTYAEHVKMTSSASIYGGFACAGFGYSGVKAKVAPADKGAALELRGAKDPVVVADLELTAVDGVAKGESSIGVMIEGSTRVTLRRAVIVAGKGIDGENGAEPAAITPATAPNGTTGGGETPNPLCTTSVGGAAGKDGATSGTAGKVAKNPVYPAGYSGAGGPGGVACFAMDGSYGEAGTPGAGAASVGTLDASGWKGADGAEGGKGGDGQGGGGGGQKAAAGIGGSGGPGSCGGQGGGKGLAGGSSLALVVVASGVALEQTSLTAKDAGNGGAGGKGQKAQLAGTPGVKNGANACDGGFGGIGGSGGGGGGGAGGLSAGILYKGTAPTIDGASVTAADTLASVTLGKAGALGSKGLGGDAAQTTAPVSRAGDPGSDGKPGDAKAVMSAP